MKINYLYIVLVAIALSFTACNNFLDVEPKGIVLPKTYSDYEAMLNAPEVTASFPDIMLNFSDDAYFSYSPSSVGPDANAYFWNPILDPNNDDAPVVWSDLYKTIYYTNVVVNNVMDAEGGNESIKKQIYAEALVFRAQAYFHLLTVFSKAYDKSTSDTDLGVPIVTSVDVKDPIPNRATVQENIDQIIEDVEHAYSVLSMQRLNATRVNKSVAAAVLSRVYLYIEDYEKANEYAELAMGNTYQLEDYNIESYAFGFPEENPENLWIVLNKDYYAGWMPEYSSDLESNYDFDDLRYMNFAIPIEPTLYYNGAYNLGLTVGELVLNRAEALARLNKVSEAMDMLNYLRENRIADYAYEPSEATGKEEALEAVLLERRKELAFKGTRWMDIKRLVRQGRLSKLQRFDLEGNVIFTLETTVENTTFEIPSRVLMFNPSMPKNH